MRFRTRPFRLSRIALGMGTSADVEHSKSCKEKRMSSGTVTCMEIVASVNVCALEMWRQVSLPADYCWLSVIRRYFVMSYPRVHDTCQSYIALNIFEGLAETLDDQEASCVCIESKEHHHQCRGLPSYR
jgi:hypothetical protein